MICVAPRGRLEPQPHPHNGTTAGFARVRIRNAGSPFAFQPQGIMSKLWFHGPRPIRAIGAQVDRHLVLHAFTFIANVTLRVVLCRNLFSRRCRQLPLLLGIGELLHLPQDQTPINPGHQSKKHRQQHLPAK